MPEPSNKSALIFVAGLVVGSVAGIYVWETFFPRPSLFDRATSLNVNIIERLGVLKVLAKGETSCAAAVISALLRADLEASLTLAREPGATPSEKEAIMSLEKKMVEAKAFLAANPQLASPSACRGGESNSSMQSGPEKAPAADLAR